MSILGALSLLLYTLSEGLLVKVQIKKVGGLLYEKNISCWRLFLGG